VIFIFATSGLLAWALLKPWVDRLRQRDGRREFEPLVDSDSRARNDRGAGAGSGPRNATSILPRSQQQQEEVSVLGVNGKASGRGARFIDADEDAMDIGSSGSGSTAGPAR